MESPGAWAKMSAALPDLNLDTRGSPEERYEILGRIAAGAMGQIYLARTRLANGRRTEVALKRIKPELQKDEGFVQMFYDEARIASKMRHSNIIGLLELGELDGSIFYAMELVPGINLSDVLRHLTEKGERMPLQVVLDVVVPVLDALEYAHTFTGEDGRPFHLVHRDVSPHNILIGFDGRVKLLDFGVTKAEGQLHKTQPGMVKGKLGYMAPEQIRTDPVDARTDLFALGVVMFEAALFRHPFYGKTDPEVIASIMRNDPPNPRSIDSKFPEMLSEVLMKALAKEPGDRFLEATLMRRALLDFIEATNGAVSQDRLQRFMRSHFADRIALHDRARRSGDSSLMVLALAPPKKRPRSVKQIGPGKLRPAPAQEPVLLPPPGLAAASPAGSPDQEPTSEELVPRSLRQRSLADTGDLPRVSVDQPDRSTSSVQVGGYTLLQRLHAGRREIYRARSSSEVSKRVALKRLAPESASDEGERECLLAELTLGAGLSHPNLVTVHEVVLQDGAPVGALELVEGASLQQILDRCRARRTRMPIGVACRLIADLARALHYLHTRPRRDGSERGVLHRDIAPAHVLVGDHGALKLGSLSMAREIDGKGVRPDRVRVSPYAPPERFLPELGEESPASDVYAAGVLLLECLTGIAPPDDGTEESIRQAAIGEHAPDRQAEGLALPGPVKDLLVQAVARSPGDRFWTADRFARAAEHALYELDEPVTTLEVEEWLRKLSPSHPVQAQPVPTLGG